jgi:hypothetical protein
VHLALAIGGCIYAIRSRNRQLKMYALAFAAAATAAAWLSTVWASTIWEHAPLLQYMAFPWRALVLPGLLLPLLALFAFERVGPKWTVALALGLVLFNLPHTEPHGYLTFDDEYYAPQSIASKGLTTTTREEYAPRDVDVPLVYDARGLFGVSAPLDVREISRSSTRQEFLVSAQAQATVEASTSMYPGWSVTIDGAPGAIATAPQRGTIRFDVPGGQHRVVLQFGPTPLRRVALGITLASFVLLIAAFAFSRKLVRLPTKLPPQAPPAKRRRQAAGTLG